MRKAVNTIFIALCCALVIGCNTDDELSPEEISDRQEQIIQEFLDDNSLIADKTSSGMYFLVETPAAGAAKPLYGDTVVVNFTSMELGSKVGSYEYGTTYGEIFQSTYFEGEPLELSVGQVYNTPFFITGGWREALEMMELGSRKVFFMPSNLGFGQNGYPPFIGGNSVVVYDIELVEIKPAF